MGTSKAFVRGALILTLAALISKLLGSIYTIILQNLIGDRGMGIYQMAYPVYATLLVISTAGFPVAISKYVSEYTAMNDTQNANKIFRSAFLMLAATGFVAMSGLYLFSTKFAALAGDPRATWALKAIAPALFIVPILSSMRGYFQGWQSMRPTAISQIVEQLIRVITIIAGVLIVLALGGKDRAAAAVASFGAVTGGLAGLAVMMIELWRFYRREKHVSTQKRLRDRSDSELLSTIEILRKLVYYAVPVSLSALVIPLFSNIDAFTVTNLLKAHGYTQNAATHLYGLLSGRAFKLLMLPATLVSSIGVALLPAVSEANVRSGEHTVRSRVMLGFRFTMLLALPASVGLMLLAGPIDIALFRDDQGVQAIMWMGVATFFSSIQMNSAASLQGLGLVYTPLVSLLIGTISKITLNFILVPYFQISGGAAATAISYGIVGIWNWLVLARRLHLRIVFTRHLLKPLMAVFVMGAGVYAAKVQWERLALVSSPRLSAMLLVIVAVLIGVVLYGVMIVSSGMLTEREVRSVPKIGRPLGAFLRRIRIY